MQIRELTEFDLVTLAQIEAEAQSSPWSQAAFLRCWESKFPGWVLEIEQKIVGFIFISIAASECHILNICIHPSQQRQGLGQKLLMTTLLRAKERGADTVYLEVRRSNHGAIHLYRQMNFKLIGERRNYYTTPKGPEDALVFARDLAMLDETDLSQ